MSSKAIVRRTLGRIKRFVLNPKQVLMRRFHPRLREEIRLARLTGPGGYWQELRAYQLNFLKTMGLQPHHSLLDIGCGPLQGGIAFMSYLEPGNYVGIDIRDVPLTEAYKQIVKHRLVHKSPHLILSDSFGQNELNGRLFDYAWACQMLYHLDEAALHRYFECVAKHLKPGGVLYGDILSPDNKIPDDVLWNGLRHRYHTMEFMETTSRQYGLAMKHVGQIKDYGYPVPCDLRLNDMLQFQKQ